MKELNEKSLQTEIKFHFNKGSYVIKKNCKNFILYKKYNNKNLNCFYFLGTAHGPTDNNQKNKQQPN